MFDIQARPFGKYTAYKLINQQSGEYAVVVPEVGANVVELVLKSKDVLFPVIQGYSTDEALEEHTGYRSSRLLPFPNRISDGTYTYNGAVHKLEINRAKEGHAIHGLFYNKPFKVDEYSAGPHEAVLTLHLDYNGERPGYPFLFQAELRLSLTEGGFESKTTLTNTGGASLPVGDGWHPYFSLNGNVDDLLLTVPDAEEIVVSHRNIPNGELKTFSRFKKAERIGPDQMDCGLKLKENGEVVTELYDKKTGVKLGVWQETGPTKYNYLQLYIPKSRDAIAIEPMTCATNAFNNGQGLIELNPGQSFDARYGVFVK